MENKLKPATFELECLEGREFKGYTMNEEWNGFACPYFTKEQADVFIDEWNSQKPLGTAHTDAHYDDKADAYIFPADLSPDIFVGTNPEGKHLYGIGAFGWTWSEKLNENCLDNMRCPECGSLGPFNIGVTTVVRFSDEGEDFLNDKGGDQEWNDVSYCMCCECEWAGKVYDFYIEKPDRKPTAEQQLLEAARWALSCLENCYTFTRENQEYDRRGEITALREAIARMEAMS